MQAAVDPLDTYDEFGRLFGSDTPLPCREHWDSEGLQRELLEHVLVPLPNTSIARSELTDAELARYLVCQPDHFRNHWLHPRAFAFHGYKDPALLRHADEVVRGRAACDWFAPHWQPELAPLPRAGPPET